MFLHLSVILFRGRGSVINHRWDHTPPGPDPTGRNIEPDRKWHHITPWKEHGTRQKVTHTTTPPPPRRCIGLYRKWHHTPHRTPPIGTTKVSYLLFSCLQYATAQQNFQKERSFDYSFLPELKCSKLLSFIKVIKLCKEFQERIVKLNKVNKTATLTFQISFGNFYSF